MTSRYKIKERPKVYIDILNYGLNLPVVIDFKIACLNNGKIDDWGTLSSNFCVYCYLKITVRPEKYPNTQKPFICEYFIKNYYAIKIPIDN